MMLLVTCVLALVAAPLADVSGGVAVELVSRDGKAISGRLVPAAEGRFGLASDNFAGAMEVELGRVATLKLAPPSGEGNVPDEGVAVEAPDGGVAVQLVDGELLRGALLGVAEGVWRLEAEGLGTLELSSSSISSIESLGGGAILFQGPHGLTGWSGQLGEDGWGAAPGELLSSKGGTRLGRDFGLDEDRRLDLDLTWKGRPHFRIALVNKSEKRIVKHCVTVEAWGRSLVAWSEEDKRVSVVELAEGLPDDGSLSLHVRTESGELVFFGDAGEELGRISRPKRSGSSLVVVNDGQQLTVTALRVADGGVELQRLDAGQVTGFDVERGVYLTADGEVAAGRVLGVDFQAAATSEPLVDGLVLLEYRDGRRVRGRFVRLTESGVELEVGWSAGPVTASLNGLQTLHAGEPKTGGRKRSDKSFVVTAGGDLGGELEAIEPDGAISWRPDLSEGAVTLDGQHVSKIVLNRTSAYFASSRKWPHRVLLNSGEAFQAKLISIDDQAVVLNAPFGEDIKIASDSIRAVEFDRRSMARFEGLLTAKKPQNQNPWGQPINPRREVSAGFDLESLERALALPRKYKTRAFPHLVLARTGDFLRTNVVSWSPAGVLYANRAAEPRLIPEERVAAVVWLRTVEGSEEREPMDPPAQALVVLDEQTKLWLDLVGLDGEQLVGTSPTFGALKLDLSEILSIELDLTDLPVSTLFDDWMLHPMKEPFPDDPDAVASAEVIAVGTAAPKTEGEDLDGKPLNLMDYRGQVVLLDFWAHW